MFPCDSTIIRLEKALETSRERTSSDFDLNPGAGPAPGTKFRPAAVMVPLVAREDGWKVILTRRTDALKHHPGQVAFPGGKQDAADPSLEATAFREAGEEIGLPEGAARAIGRAGSHKTVTGFDVTPVAAVVDPGFRAMPEPGEVAEVFEVPLVHLFDPERCRVEKRLWNGTERRYYTMPYGPYYIWGATARIVVALREAWRRVA